MATGKLASLLSRLNPVPGFPEYTGPYKVGTVDVEIPVSDLEAPSAAPDGAEDIHTVQFRIYYPATADSDSRRISWVPAPQRSHVSAYAKFLGVGPALAELFSFLPRHIHYTSIPAHKNATLEPLPTSQTQWPTMIFSHGLAGNRNAYSHIVGSIASHGVVVICPEHRDGSAAVTFVRDPAAQDRYFRHNTRISIPFKRIPHREIPEIWEARDAQLRIRCWEMGLIHEAVMEIQAGNVGPKNMNTSTPAASLLQFAGKMAVDKPGDIIWSGHSFGGATIVQLLKSTYWATHPSLATITDPLFVPSPDSRLVAQVTPRNPILLLDMWCFSLLSPFTKPLWDLPLPCFADTPISPGGKALMAIESEAFYKWKAHLHATARILSPDPSAPVVTAEMYEAPSGMRFEEASLFYVQNSPHLNPSYFGLLFPWLTRRIFGSEEPERALRLNWRAAVQFLRRNDIPVARTWVGDLVEGAHEDKLSGAEGEGKDGIDDDVAIFDRSGEKRVEAWVWVDTIGLGEESEGSSGGTPGDKEDRKGSVAGTGSGDEERRMEGELEPHLAVEDPVAPEATNLVVETRA